MARRLFRIPLIAALVLVFLGFAGSGVAMTVYIDTTGDDTNPGTVERPIRSIEALSQRIWRPGDAIYLHGGQRFSGVLKLAGNGSDLKPIIVGSYGGGRATIDSAGQTFFMGYNQGGFQFQDLDLTSSSYTGDAEGGILFYTDSPVGTRYAGITVKNCDLHGFGGAGIKIGTSEPSNPGWSTISIANCRSCANGEGMAVYGCDTSAPRGYPIGALQVTHSEFSGNSGSGLSISGVSGALVEYCSFHDNQRTGGCWTWAARNVVIQHCVSYRNHCAGENDGFGFDFDGGSIGCTIQYCLSYQNDTAGFAIFDYPNSALTSDNTIRFCISENDVRYDKEGASYVINSWANTPIRNSRIYNCAAYLTSRGGQSICAGFMGIGRQAAYGIQSGSIGGCGFWNNIIYLAGGGSDLVHLYCQYGAVAPGQISYLGNDYAMAGNAAPRILTYKALYSNLADFRKRTGQERAVVSRKKVDCGITADPRCYAMGQFQSEVDPVEMAHSNIWRLLAKSPCVGAGIDLRNVLRIDPGRVDFYGNPLPQAGAMIGAAGPASFAR